MIDLWIKKQVKEALVEDRREQQTHEIDNYELTREADLYITACENGWIIKVMDNKQRRDNKTHVCLTAKEMHDKLDQLFALHLMGIK